MAEKDSMADGLVEEGLQRYSQGQLDAALRSWRMALELAPEHHRAREYLKYVEENRTGLEESFRLTRDAPDGGAPDAIGADGESGAAAPAAAVPSETKASGGEAWSTGAAEEGVLDFEPCDPRVRDPSFDPSFNRFASEIEETAAEIDRQLAISAPASGSGSETEDEDYTPRIDLSEIRDRVAATRERLSREMSAVAIGGDASAAADGGDASAAVDGETADAPADPSIPGQPWPGSMAHPIATPASPSLAVGHGRSRRPTPLTLIEGGRESAASHHDFEPLEATPLGIVMPEPTRLVREGSPPAVGITAEAGDLPEPSPPVSPERSALSPSEATPNRPDAALHAVATRPGLGKFPPIVERVQTPRATPMGLGPEADAAASDPATTAREGAEEEERLESMLTGAWELHEQGTFEGSLWLCERILRLDPQNAEVLALQQKNRGILRSQFESQLGDKRQVPVVQVPQHEIVWHKLDHRAGFLLSRIDGHLSFEELLDVAGMPEFEACRILAQLLRQGIIGPRS